MRAFQRLHSPKLARSASMETGGMVSAMVGSGNGT